MRESTANSENPAIIVLSPHIDDEVLGCYSFLGPLTRVVYCGVENRPAVPRERRIDEASAAAERLGFQWELLEYPVNQYEVNNLIGAFENCINLLRPELILIPQPNSYNQDHRAVHAAAMIATRPHDQNWLVPAVLIYEQPHTLIWPNGPAEIPALFREIDIEDKLAAYRLYASQVRRHRAPDLVRSIAKLRGAQIGRPFAEGFGVTRLIYPMDKRLNT